MRAFLEDHGPFVWHVAEAESLRGILAHGLMPANALLPPGQRGAWRSGFQASQGATLRFQQMSDAQLRPWLRGRFAGDPAAWRAHIDDHVFFWCCPEARDRFLQATMRERRRQWLRERCAGQPPTPVILRYELAQVIEAAGSCAHASLINSGTLIMGKTWRDEETLRSIATWDGRWRTPGGQRRRQAMELAVRGKLPPELPFAVEASGG